MTAVALTRITDATTGQPGVRLYITEAAEPPGTRYASNFTSGVDAWAVTLGTATLTSGDTSNGTPPALNIAGTADAVDVGRDVTGLTVGQKYRYTVDVKRRYGQVRIGVENITKTAWVTTGADWTTLTYEWTATATTHKIKVYLQRAGGTWSTQPQYLIRNATVNGPIGTWKSLRVTRTDANGTDVPVWNPGLENGGETYGGDLNLYDFEAALAGPVSYTVKDGADGTATGTITLGSVADPAWISLPRTAWPYWPAFGGHGPQARSTFKVTAWSMEQASLGRSHQIIGRTNRVGNPGPLALRTGTFEVLSLTFADAKALRDLLDGGDVALLQQPTHPGLDLYFTVNRVSVRMDTESQTWTTTVDCDEVQRP